MGEGEKRSDLAKVVDFLFEKPEYFLLILVFLFGSVLRYVAALNIEPNADEMVHGPHAYGIINAGVIGRVWQSITWSYLTDIFYQIMGISMFAARFSSFLFGILTIILVYLLSMEIFNRKTAIISTVLIAFSGFHVIFTLIEMDIAAIFLVLLATLVFLKKIKKDGKISYVSAVILGIAALIKTLSLFFVPAFLIYYFIYHKKINLPLLKKAAIFCIIITTVFSPIFIHNYLWYKDKGMVDAYLSQYFNVSKSREAYAGIQGIKSGFGTNDVMKGIVDIIRSMLHFDLLITSIGIISLAYVSIRKKEIHIFFAIFQLSGLFFIAITNRLPTHYVIFIPVLCIYSAAFIKNISEKISKEKSNLLVALILIIVIVSNMWNILGYVGSQTALTDMRKFASENIKPGELVIADSRIYRGRIMWLFLDKIYLESALLPDVLAANEQIQGRDVPIRAYFVECVIDDCGWGTIKDQPEFNKSMEDMASQLKSQMILEKEINGGGSPELKNREVYFRIYKADINLKPEILDAIKINRNFFYYPAEYSPKEHIFDSYSLRSEIDYLLFYIAKAIIWLSILGCLVSIIYLGYLFYQAENNLMP